MVHPYVCVLKHMFAPKAENNETLDSYKDLIYGSLISENIENIEDNTEDDNASDSDFDNDDFPDAGNQQHW
jgi:hypothetical protein